MRRAVSLQGGTVLPDTAAAGLAGGLGEPRSMAEGYRIEETLRAADRP